MALYNLSIALLGPVDHVNSGEGEGREKRGGGRGGDDGWKKMM